MWCKINTFYLCVFNSNDECFFGIEFGYFPSYLDGLQIQIAMSDWMNEWKLQNSSDSYDSLETFSKTMSQFNNENYYGMSKWALKIQLHPAGAKESIFSAKLRAKEKEIERKPIPKRKLRNNWRNAFELLKKKNCESE